MKTIVECFADRSLYIWRCEEKRYAKLKNQLQGPRIDSGTIDNECNISHLVAPWLMVISGQPLKRKQANVRTNRTRR